MHYLDSVGGLFDPMRHVRLSKKPKSISDLMHSRQQQIFFFFGSIKVIQHFSYVSGVIFKLGHKSTSVESIFVYRIDLTLLQVTYCILFSSRNEVQCPSPYLLSALVSAIDDEMLVSAITK